MISLSQSLWTRREFARFIALGSVGVALIDCAGDARQPGRPLSPQWWLELYADGRVRMLTKRVEMGQGAHTGLRTLVGEELDVDPSTIEIVQVESDPKYGDITTGGSFTLVGWQERMRTAGATARYLLIQAAARRWRVPPAEIVTRAGEVFHAPGNRTAPYRSLVRAAAALPAPDPGAVALKPPSAWRYIGKRGPIAHHDRIVTGKAEYGIDVRLQGMCFAVLARAPRIGARLKSFDDAAAASIAGYLRSVALKGNSWPGPNHCREAIAVVAKDSWSAQLARAALRVEWDLDDVPAPDTASIFAELDELCARPGIVAARHGSEPAGGDVAQRIETAFRQPFLSHAPLEPPNATAGFVDGTLHVWCGNQNQTRLKQAIAEQCALDPARIVVHATLIGGSFGRRLEIDYGVEAAQVAVALRRPVQVLWTREDDMKFGLYRSGSVHRLQADVNAAGRMLSFQHRYAAHSVLRQQDPTQIAADGGDWTLAAPLAALLYDVPHAILEHHAAPPRVPCAWWRGTYWNNVTAAVECFIDEVAQRVGHDPLAFRLAHLQGPRREFVVNDQLRVPFDPARMRRALEMLAARSQWNAAAPDGSVRGVACGIYDSPECHAAVAVEMSLRGGEPVLDVATVAVDVGTAVNPRIVEAQAEGGFIMGASAALRECVDWRAGVVEQSGFNDYPVLRMPGAPRIEVVIVPSDAGICGVGEIVTPAAIAAVTNAASRLLGRRIRSLPILGNGSETTSNISTKPG